MHKRPRLKEALNTLSNISEISKDAENVLLEYHELKESGKEFLAGRLVIDVVDHYFHIQNSRGVVNG